MAQAARKRKEDQFAQLSDDSIRCRVNGHIWRPQHAVKVVGAFETQEACERCSSERYSIISNRGEVMSRRIHYADHYLATDGPLESADRDAMRLTVIKWDFSVHDRQKKS